MSDNARVIITIDDQGGSPGTGATGSPRTGAPSQTGQSQSANPLSLSTGSLGPIPLLGMGINAPSAVAGAQNVPATTGSPLALAIAGNQPQMAQARPFGPAPSPLMAGTNTGMMMAAAGHGINIGNWSNLIKVNAATGTTANLNPLGANIPMGLGAGGQTAGGAGVAMGMLPYYLQALGPVMAMRNKIAGMAGAAAGWATSMIPGVGAWGGVATGAATAWGLGKLGASFLPAAAGVTAVSVVAIAGSAVRSMANALVAGLRERIQYSGAMTQAAVSAELRQLGFNIRDAQRYGSDYARFMNKTSQLDIAFQEMMSPLKRIIMEILEPFMDLFRGVFKFLAGILEAVKPLADIINLALTPLTWIGKLLESIGKTISDITKWMKGQEDDLLKTVRDMLDILPHQQMKDVPGLQRQNINQRLRIPAFAGIN